MNKPYRKLFKWSLLFYLAVTIFTRFYDNPGFDPFSRALYSLPLEFNDGRDSIQFQTHFLSKNQVAEFLKTPEQNPAGFEIGKDHPEYLLLSLDDRSGYHFGYLKVYFSCFAHPITLYFHSASHMNKPINFILPLPPQKEQLRPCKVNLRWKNFWGQK